MIAIEDPVWEKQSSAYGDVRRMLQDLLSAQEDRRELIADLAENISHQLSYYSATAYILPHLAALAPKLNQYEQIYLISELGPAIAAESSEPLPKGSQEYQEFHEGLAALKELTLKLVISPESQQLLHHEKELRAMFAMAAVAILGDRSHALTMWMMSGSIWEEIGAACCCGWGEECLEPSEDNDIFQPVTIDAWDGSSMEHEAVWLNGLLERIDEQDLRKVLPFLYGTIVCPDCGRTMTCWDSFKLFLENF